MSDIIQLKSGKFKGVEFLFSEMPTTGGNRLIKYNFPGSDKQNIERQGLKPRAYTFTIWVPAENYYQERDDLLRVLDDGEEGTLTHPTFGDIESVIAGSWRLDERISELGRATVQVTFEVNNSSGVPQQSEAIPAQVQQRSIETNAQQTADVAGGYEVTQSFVGNFTDALDNAAGAINAIGDSISAVVTPVSDAVADFRASVQRLLGAVGGLIQAPAELAAQLDGILADLANLYEAPDDTLAAFEALFVFGDDDPVIVPDTPGKAERKQNRDLLRSMLQVQALSYAYTSASEATYQTTDDLDAVQAQLEAQYLKIRNDETISNAALELLDRVRVQAGKTLDAARVNTRTIITIETRRMPLSVLIYSYYGRTTLDDGTDLVDVVADLNNVTQNAFVEGALRILTA